MGDTISLKTYFNITVTKADVLPGSDMDLTQAWQKASANISLHIIKMELDFQFFC